MLTLHAITPPIDPRFLQAAAYVLAAYGTTYRFRVHAGALQYAPPSAPDDWRAFGHWHDYLRRGYDTPEHLARAQARFATP